MLCNEESQYSIYKTASITRIVLERVCANGDGSINIHALQKALARHEKTPVILTLTCGTTMKEGFDDIVSVMKLLQQTNCPRSDCYIHVDGDLSAAFLPFSGALLDITPSFYHDVDAITTYDHKFPASPIPLQRFGDAKIAHRRH